MADIKNKEEIKTLAVRGQFTMGMLSNLFEQYKEQIALAIPRHLTPERMIRVALSAVGQNPDLLTCNPYTLCGAVVQSSILGLEPNSVLGESYLIPFKNKKARYEKQVQLITGYQGKIKLVENTGNLLGLHRKAVRENDEFEFEDGLEPFVRHKYHHIPFKERGPVIGYWAGVVLKSGFKKIDFARVDEMIEHRDRFAMTRGDNGVFGVWIDNFDAMALKTMIHRVLKDIPKSVQAQTAWQLDERADNGVGQKFSIDVPLDFQPEGEDESTPIDIEPIQEPQRKSATSPAPQEAPPDPKQSHPPQQQPNGYNDQPQQEPKRRKPEERQPSLVG